MNSLDEVFRLKRVHTRWIRINILCGLAPLFAIVNKFQPMLTDGYGNDLVPTLLPTAIGAHYNAILAFLLALLTASELLRRRFHRVHEQDLKL